MQKRDSNFILKDSLGNKIIEGKVVNGLKQGVWKYWYVGGKQLQAEGAFIVGKKTGVWKSYHKNGTLASKGQYNDKFYKQVTDTFPDDGLYKIIEREVGKDGKWEYWDKQGKLVQLDMYENGEIVESKKWH